MRRLLSILFCLLATTALAWWTPSWWKYGRAVPKEFAIKFTSQIEPHWVFENFSDTSYTGNYFSAIGNQDECYNPKTNSAGRLYVYDGANGFDNLFSSTNGYCKYDGWTYQRFEDDWYNSAYEGVAGSYYSDPGNIYTHVKVPGSSSLTTANSTIECWFHTAVNGIQFFIAGPIGGAGWQFLTYSGSIYAAMAGNSSVSWSGTYNDDKWHHIAAVANKNANTLRIYLDGTNVVETTFPNTPTTGDSSDWWIGARTDGYNNQGVIDEMRLSNAAIYTSDFIPTRSYETNETTIAYWRMNEGSGTNVVDMMGAHNAYFATGNDAPSWTVGR